jgi:hypothetical protein
MCISNTRTSSVASLSSTDENEEFVIYAQDEEKFPDAKWREERQEVDRASSEQKAQELVGTYKIAYGQGFRVWFVNTRAQFVPEGKQRVWCEHCEMISINGVPCHESDCPNQSKVWDPNAITLYQSHRPDREYGEWVDR